MVVVLSMGLTLVMTVCVCVCVFIVEESITRTEFFITWAMIAPDALDTSIYWKLGFSLNDV